MRKKADQAQETARNLRERLKPVLDALGPLNRDMQAKAAAIIKAVGEKLLTEQREAQRQAAVAEARAKRDAERAERDAQRQAQAQQREAERAQQEQARQAAAAEREAQRQADAAKRAEEAKRRECTASLVARLRCTKEGYNPITGRKKAAGE